MREHGQATADGRPWATSSGQSRIRHGGAWVSENKPSHDRPKPADYHRLLHHMPVAWAYHLAVLDDEGEPVDYVFLDINETFTSFTGMKGEDVLGKRVTQVIPGIEEADPDLIRVYGRVAITGEPAELEFFFPPLDRWYQVTATCPKEGYFACTFLDVSRQKDAEEAVRQHQENLQEPGGEIEQGALSYAIMTGGRYASLDELAQVVVGRAAVTDASGRAQVAISLPDNLTRYRVMVVAVAGGSQFDDLTARGGRGPDAYIRATSSFRGGARQIGLALGSHGLPRGLDTNGAS